MEALSYYNQIVYISGSRKSPAPWFCLSSLTEILFSFTEIFFFPFLYGNIWKYRRKKTLFSDSYKRLCFETQMHEVALQIFTFKNIEIVDRRYSTMFGSVWKTVHIIHSITCTNHGYRSQFALKSLPGSSHSVLQSPLPLASSSDKEQTLKTTRTLL